MKKLVVSLALILFLISHNTRVYSETINESDTDLCEALKYALINSHREPVNKAMAEFSGPIPNPTPKIDFS